MAIGNLKSNYPIKTASTKNLASCKLEISDINNLPNLLNNIDLSNYVKKDGSVVMTGNLELPDLQTSSTTSCNDTLQQIDHFQPSTEGHTNISGTLNVSNITSRSFSLNGGTNIQYLMGDGSQ